MGQVSKKRRSLELNDSSKDRTSHTTHLKKGRIRSNEAVWVTLLDNDLQRETAVSPTDEDHGPVLHLAQVEHAWGKESTP